MLRLVQKSNARLLKTKEVFQMSTRAHSSQGVDAKWEDKWNELVGNLYYHEDFNKSADQLRDIVKSGMLKFTDLRDNPDRFFAAHRTIAERSTELGPGFFIRFTVQYNLFAGTILGLAGDEQLEMLDTMQEKGHLGCFALTEKFAGVNSGLVVNTDIEWDNEKKVFIMNTKDGSARKNWISQGFVADKAVVVANLKVQDRVVGPHAFVMDFRNENGELVDNVMIDDMGIKTVGNDLDNAWIHFDNVELPRSAMLNRYANIDADGQYVLNVPGIRPFDMIGQRLFSGRIAVAQAAMAYRKSLYANTKLYTDEKKCWAPGASSPQELPSLSDIPQLVDLYDEETVRYEQMESFLDSCEKELNMCLESNSMPDMALIEAIAVAKVKAVEESIEMTFRLKQEVGSYALMKGSGFEQMDFLQCCKFAEGDSRILMLKMARDRLSEYKRNIKAVEETSLNTTEDDQCRLILKSSAESGMNSVSTYKEMNKLAEMITERTIQQYGGRV